MRRSFLTAAVILLSLGLLGPGLVGVGVGTPAPAAAQEIPHIPLLPLWLIPRTDAVSAGCDQRDPAACLLPFPSNRYTVADGTTPTGRRVDFSVLATPRTFLGKPIDPTEWNRNDGFSPGSPILTVVPGINLRRTGAAPITDIGRSLEADQPIVLLNTRTGERHPFWAEMDANATRADRQALIIRPAVNMEEGTRYVVALRNLRDSQGGRIGPGSAFAAELRRPAADTARVLRDLSRAGVSRGGLFLAWDFTVASTQNLTERMVHIRDDAFAALGRHAPQFRVTGIASNPNEEIARRVTGEYTVPNYLNIPTGPPGSRFNYLGSSDGLPVRNGNLTATFTCNIPHSAFRARARVSLYGHGLLGSQDEVGAGNVRRMGATHNFVFCATDWIGMATLDIPNVATILLDLSNFPTLADRVQQGILNQLFLGRLLKHPQGFASDPAFRAAGRPVIDNRAVFYDGNSQGGIIGGALMAVAQDITRGVLGVPGMNYATLLNRSIDFDPYSGLLYNMYPDKLDQQIAFAMIQMLWDRAESNGYAAHISKDPLPNTPVHQVLLVPAFGDHQVANVSTEVQARTIGAATNVVPLRGDRPLDVEPLWGIPRITQYPYPGSAIIYWDSFETPPPPVENLPPRQGRDPHGYPRGQENNQLMKSQFLRINGMLVDTCGGSYCS